MSRIDIRLVFTLTPRDSALQYKRCVHLWNSFPCIITLGGTIYWSQRNYWILTDNILPDQNELWTRIETIMNLPHKKKWIKTIITLKRKIFNYVFSDTLTYISVSLEPVLSIIMFKQWSCCSRTLGDDSLAARCLTQNSYLIDR